MKEKISSKKVQEFKTGSLTVELCEHQQKIRKYIKNFSSMHNGDQIDLMNHDPVLTSYEEVETKYELIMVYRNDNKEIKIIEELYKDYNSADINFSKTCILATKFELFPIPAKLMFFDD